MRPWPAIALLAACTDNTVVVTPIIDIPTNDTAQALGLDTITLSIAHAGADDDITSATFSHGDVIELPNVPFGDDLVVHMVGRIGSKEEAYGRTCQFSVRPDARVPSPHLYFSKEVKFGQMSQQPLPRLGGSAMMYRDGAGLVVGGTFPDESQQPQALTQIERFDPNTGQYDTLHDIARRVDAAVAILGTGPDSRMVIVGGIDPSTATYGLDGKLKDPPRAADFVEVIEAERNTDRQYEKFYEPTMKRVGLTATTLSDGRVVVIGGRCAVDCVAEGANPKAVEEISVSTGTTAVTESRATLKYWRYGHTATRLTDELGAAVLVAGGLDPVNNTPVPQAELYKPLAGDFSQQFTAQMVVPRYHHQAVRLPDGSVLFIGGIDKDGKTIDRLELFSPLDATFIDVGKLPATAGRIDLAATTLPDGRVLISGGRINSDKDVPVNTAFIARLDPLDGTVDVVPTNNLAVARAGHQATALCDGTVLVSGGTDGQAPYERYNPTSAGRR